ncbi:hypothetical protein Caci_2918 [Catenulispora acidiphila DSM 44928]|uniref:Uncharacterized protein n=1 Tax=Catenulispora acidiphila (strain DSM 44928 / JCM 14897 / NBRC 102108 / NRRL B-24433 / ID139908) TaxID=479433 RepID=C7Q2T5_CATAD|nr:hypothetical protein [Catenulispora acidiphila]ACU71827.1 hypothetical protein Caci_2918 [Catenulispora acidiphila DSM 44928]
MTDTSATNPEWIPVWYGYDREFLVRFTDADNRRHDWHVRSDNFDGTGRRRHMAWHAWPDIPDPERWDKPVFLHRRLADAKDEFALVVMQGWRRGFGYTESVTGSPIYGRDSARRERRFLVAELHGRGICPRCGKLVHVRTDGMLNAHNRPRSLDRCDGTHGPAVAELKTLAQMAEAGL